MTGMEVFEMLDFTKPVQLWQNQFSAENKTVYIYCTVHFYGRILA
jgi:hypothetical protein